MLTWRERFLIACGPGVLGGITLGDWLRLLAENRFAVDLAYLPRAAFVTFAATMNSPGAWLEKLRYGRRWKEVTVQPPLFVLGHWRSGTTHLHYLLSQDERFAFPALQHVHFPHTFLTTERGLSARFMGFLLPRHRPYDNVRLAPGVPDEDEFAMCVSGFMTSYLTGVFPRRAEHYDRFLTFRSAAPHETLRWKSSLHTFLQKVTLSRGKPLIVKSPGHTGRIKLLLEMYPGAKFVHIRRNPYTVFQSFVHTHETGLPFGRLQDTRAIDWSERVLRQYKEVHEAFFEERGLIPAGHFHELSYEELEQDPVGQVRKIYQALNLPDFAAAEPKLRSYLASLSGYRKNVFPELLPDLRQRVAEEWGRCFAEWGYSL